jgi:hypothetical protein
LVAASVLLAVAVALLVVRRVALEARAAVEDVHRALPDVAPLGSSKVLDRAEDLVERRQAPTGPPDPPR